MPEPALFIGVVSHSGSRFEVSQGPDGLAARIAERLPSTHVQVNTANLLNEAELPVTPELVQASLTAEVTLDRIWARYLDRRLGLRWWAGHALRWARRTQRAIRPPSPAMIRRLLNIELSHLDLMRAGLASGAPWVLILEDDALASDPEDVSRGLAGLMAAEPPADFINLSRSFDQAALGIEHLLTESQCQWSGSAVRAIQTADRPVTNTVCAILYRADFLADLVAALDSLPMTPVVPIDWKLNLALMNLFEAGRTRAGSCWLIEPAPITQMSMQPTEILHG